MPPPIAATAPRSGAARQRQAEAGADQEASGYAVAQACAGAAGEERAQAPAQKRDGAVEQGLR